MQPCLVSLNFTESVLLVTDLRAGGSEMEVVRPAAQNVIYKLFMRRSCFPALFFTFFAFGCNTEYRIFA